MLLAFSALAVGLYIFVRLDRSAAEWLGPVGEAVHDLFNQVPGAPAPLTRAGRRLQQDARQLGGEAGVSIVKPGYFGTIGQQEWVNVTVRSLSFDDASLEELADLHGPEIRGLYLHNTGVTDAGLKSLRKFTNLKILNLRIDPPRRIKPGEIPPAPKLTDAGLIHLKGIDTLEFLDLSNLPITDSGLDAIQDLPNLMALYLSQTKVQGASLAKLKSLSRLNILYLDGTPLTEDSLKSLTGATTLQILGLNKVHLTENALPLLKALKSVEQFELTGCGLLDEEIADLIKSRPGLKVNRR